MSEEWAPYLARRFLQAVGAVCARVRDVYDCLEASLLPQVRSAPGLGDNNFDGALWSRILTAQGQGRPYSGTDSRWPKETRSLVSGVRRISLNSLSTKLAECPIERIVAAMTQSVRPERNPVCRFGPNARYWHRVARSAASPFWFESRQASAPQTPPCAK